MRLWTLRTAAVVMALGLGAAVGCGSGGCSPQNINQNSNSSSAPVCGVGTYYNPSTNQCLPRPGANNPASAPVHFTSN